MNADIQITTRIDSRARLSRRQREALERLELRTLGDLLNHFPRRWEDRRRLAPISSLRVGEHTTVYGLVRSLRQRPTRTGKSMVVARVEDGTGAIDVVWFQQPYIMELVRPGQRGYFFGEVKLRQGLQMVGPEFEVDDDEGADGESSLSLQRIVPVYPTTRGLHQRTLRRLVHDACGVEPWDDLSDAIYEALVGGSPDLVSAYRQLHFPETMQELESARGRLVFEEYLLFASRLHLRRRRFRRHEGQCFVLTPDLDAKIRGLFPFELTDDQNRAVGEITADLAGPAPMYRLLQGDVGTGKTAVALYALLAAVRNGAQGVIMAPTEVLAEQHATTFRELLRDHPAVRIELLTGALQGSAREAAHRAVAEGSAHIVIGTHALIQEGVQFASLGLAVIDEQHRFGVRERARLAAKGRFPHVLVMSATPIPRSLCLTAYGDLDLSILRHRPAGRPPVKTLLVTTETQKRALRFVDEEVEKGRQAYFVYPVIEESEALDVPAALAAHTRLTKAFPRRRVGLIHGRMSAAEKDECLCRFRDREIDILVATVVVEVGIDVPNATVLFIEDASRFGLAQLHQLRGRVGRGAEQGFCLVGLKGRSAEIRQRLEIFCATSDGFRIAEEDLRLRGPGDFLGVRQSGVPVFRLGNPFREPQAFERVRTLAARLWDEPAFAGLARRYLERSPELRPESAEEAPSPSALPAAEG